MPAADRYPDVAAIRQAWAEEEQKVRAVVRRQIKIDLSELVAGADQIEFLLACQISQINHPKLAKGNENAGGPGVLGLIFGKRLRAAE